jgi:hypothetical protein
MFTEPTTFILGAGASWHYGYPTGADLIQKTIENANQNFFSQTFSDDPCDEALFKLLKELSNDKRSFQFNELPSEQQIQYVIEFCKDLEKKINNFFLN